MNKEERQSIIDEAVEKALLAFPKVIGNLISEHAMLLKNNKQFYQNYPEFLHNKQIVESVVTELDNKQPGLEYEKILEQAVPIIKDRIRTFNSLDKVKIEEPNRDLSDFNSSDNGAI